MSPFWSSLFQHQKDHGRNATTFIVALAAFVCALPLLGVFTRFAPIAVPLVSAIVLAWTAFFIRRLIVNRRRRVQFSPLSVDELRKARSKLVGKSPY
jgi:hypothetical protein